METKTLYRINGCLAELIKTIPHLRNSKPTSKVFYVFNYFEYEKHILTRIRTRPDRPNKIHENLIALGEPIVVEYHTVHYP